MKAHYIINEISFCNNKLNPSFSNYISKWRMHWAKQNGKKAKIIREMFFIVDYILERTLQDMARTALNKVKFNRASESVVFNSDQKMALRAAYVVIY